MDVCINIIIEIIISSESLLNNRNERSCILNNRVKASDLYLKEQEHISSCDRLLDEQIRYIFSIFKEHYWLGSLLWSVLLDKHVPGSSLAIESQMNRQFHLTFIQLLHFI